MGTNCDSHPEPDTANQCNVSIGDTTPDPMPGFCTLLGPAGDSYRDQFCADMSTAGEWGDPLTIENKCSYNDCNAYQDFGFGCCKGCCGILGGGMACTRVSFTGNPITCCFNDYNCNQGSEAACFSDPGQQNTCANGVNGAPNYRNLVSPDCQDAMTQYCTGTLPTDDPQSTEWLDRWTTNGGGPGSCTNALYRSMFNIGGTGHCWTLPPIQPTDICGLGLAGITGPIDAEGYFWAQNLVSAAMTRYQEQGFVIGALPGFNGFNPFQDWLSGAVCCPYPGLCQAGLDVACETYTAQRISLDPSIASWCGCHLPAGEYEDYSSKYNIPPQCTPMCNRVGTIPIVGINAEPVVCEQSVCLIDGVSLNLVRAQIGGGIDFTQVCANCGGGGCSCVVADTTIDITNSVIGGVVFPVSEGCGNVSCTQSNPGVTGPTSISVSCSGTGPQNPYAEFEAAQAAAKARSMKTSIIWTVVVIGLGLLIIFLLLLLFYPNFYSTTAPTVIQRTSLGSTATASSVVLAPVPAVTNGSISERITPSVGPPVVPAQHNGSISNRITPSVEPPVVPAQRNGSISNRITPPIDI